MKVTITITGKDAELALSELRSFIDYDGLDAVVTVHSAGWVYIVRGIESLLAKRYES